MRIAVISDIHGNLPALDAVLADIGRRGADLTVNLGDILSGPLLPRETADRLMALELPTIRGNHERQMLAPEAAAMGAADRYAAACITARQRAWLDALPATRWAADGVFMCHASPHSDVACFLENIEGGVLLPAAPTEIEERARGCSASLILCGHTHIPRLAHLATGQTIVNPGSVGSQAYHGNHPVAHTLAMGSPHARYGIVERLASGWQIEFIAVPYDWEAAARLAEAHGRPEMGIALRRGLLSPTPPASTRAGTPPHSS